MNVFSPAGVFASCALPDAQISDPRGRQTFIRAGRVRLNARGFVVFFFWSFSPVEGRIADEIRLNIFTRGVIFSLQPRWPQPSKTHGGVAATALHRNDQYQTKDQPTNETSKNKPENSEQDPGGAHVLPLRARNGAGGLQLVPQPQHPLPLAPAGTKQARAPPLLG